MRIFGAPVDAQTRCVHYAGERDVVAIKFACCERFYPCHLCHALTAGHPARQWPVASAEEPAVLCGVCRSTMSIRDYLDADCCPCCGAEFNPGCRAHRDYYFE